jgi:hypothetical protein
MLRNKDRFCPEKLSGEEWDAEPTGTMPLRVDLRQLNHGDLCVLLARSAWGQPFIYDLHGEGEGPKPISPQRHRAHKVGESERGTGQISKVPLCRDRDELDDLGMMYREVVGGELRRPFMGGLVFVQADYANHRQLWISGLQKELGS